MVKKKSLIEYNNKETGQVVKITKDEKGALYLEVDFHAGVRAKLESAVEDTKLKGALKFLAKHVPRDFHLDDVKEVTVQKEGLRVEEMNGDFNFVDLPAEEAKKFVDAIEKNTNLMEGIGKK
jgi:hypothetical protein